MVSEIGGRTGANNFVPSIIGRAKAKEKRIIVYPS
jgi:hypothetical protein